MAQQDGAFTIMEESGGEIGYRRLPGVGGVAGGSLLELQVCVAEEAVGQALLRGASLHVDLVRHVWGVEESDCAAVLMSQHGTHVTLNIKGQNDGISSVESHSRPPHPPLRVVVEMGYDPVFGVQPQVACRGLEPDAMPQLRRVSDVQDGRDACPTVHSFNVHSLDSKAGSTADVALYADFNTECRRVVEGSDERRSQTSE